MIPSIGYAAKNSFSSLHPFEFEREEPAAGDVLIDILYCGVCHSDIHRPLPHIRNWPVSPNRLSSARRE